MKKFCSVILSIMIMCSLPMTALSNEIPINNLSDIEEIEELNVVKEKISLEKATLNDCVNILNEKYQLNENQLNIFPVSELKSLIMQAEVNDFTEAEVQNYVSNLLKPIQYDSPDVFVSDDNSLFYTSDGRSFPNLLLNKHISDTYNPAYDDSTIMTQAATAGGYSGNGGLSINKRDQTGTYWKVESIPGFLEATGYFQLPSAYSIKSNDRIYMFFSGNLSENDEDLICQDFGIGYQPGVGWFPVINAWKWNPETQKYDKGPDGYSSGWIPGPTFTTQDVYIQLTATNTNNIDSFRLRVYDDNDSIRVLWDKTISWSGNPLNASASNWCIEREISMAQHNNGTLNTNTGSYFESANTYLCYLYTASQAYVWGIDQTEFAYKQAPSSAGIETVKFRGMSDRKKWMTDLVDITFNIP